MLKSNRLIARLLAIVTIFLVACGGGGEGTSPVSQKQADLILQQHVTRVVATPGERVDVTAFSLDCPRMTGQPSLCAASVSMGDVGITSPSLGLIDPWFTVDGEPPPGYFIREAGGMNRFRSQGWFVFEPGEARVSAVVSPYVRHGTVSRIGLQVASTAFDRLVLPLPARAEVEVIADPAYEPMEITSTSNYVSQGTFGELTTVTLRCGHDVRGGCFADSVLFVHDSSMHPSTGQPAVRGASWWSNSVSWEIDLNTGQYRMITQVEGVWVAPGDTGVITARGAQIFGYARVMIPRTMSGSKHIYPKLPQYCQAAIVSPETNCKG